MWRMYRYTITFTTDSLDEGKLRDLLEEQFRVYDCVVARSKVGAVAVSAVANPALSPKKQAMSAHQARLLSLFETGDLVSLKAIRKAIPGLQNSTLQKDLLKLCADGKLRKVGHGLYQSTSYPEPTDEEVSAVRNRSKVRVTGNEDARLLKYLDEPREGTDLRFFLRVSRQRVDQKVKLLMDKGLVHREPIDGKRYLYCADQQKLSAELEERQNQPSHSAKRLMECLPDAPCLVSDAAQFCGLGIGPAGEAVAELEERGLVTSFRVGGSNVVHLTDEGGRSEYAKQSERKAPASNLSEAFGDNRGDILELLAGLGEATSKELTMAMRGLQPEAGDPRMGQRVQRLRGEGLIVSMSTEQGKHPAHRLSELGKSVWNHIRSYRAPPARHVILSHISAGMEELHSRIGGNERGEWTPSGRALSMMRALQVMGKLTQREVVEVMDEPYENPRSADLALNTLRERGVVDRAGAGSSHDAYVWSLTAMGSNLVAKAADLDATESR